MLDLLAYPPVARALIALVAAGCAFPLAGVVVVRLNLITFRFALMHAALLGGAIGVAFGIHPTLATLGFGVIVVFVIGRLSRDGGAAIGAVTTMVMAVTIAIAAAITYRFDVPARETLSLLWGNVYALRPWDLRATVGFSIALVAAVIAARRSLTAVMFSPEVAFLAGIDERTVFYGVLFGVAATVSVAMRLVGALMLDVLMLLPALVAARLARSMRSLFILASFSGMISGTAGFFVSLALDIPASTGVAFVSVVLLALATIASRITLREVP